NQVVPRAELDTATRELAGEVAAMPTFGLSLAKQAVNRAEDLMGMHSGMDSSFALHHLAHAHNAEVGQDSLGGMRARSRRGSAANAVHNPRAAPSSAPTRRFPGGGCMALSLSRAGLDFRAEVRQWLRDNVPDPPLPSLETAEGFAARREWEAK